MPGRTLCTLGLMAALGGSLRAGWKITTQTSTDSDRSVVTEYFSGGLRRTDQVDPQGRRYVVVLDFDHLRQIIWNLELRQYVVMRLPRYSGFTSLPLSQQITVIDRATIDTGERRAFFGRTARHLLTRETSHAEGSAANQSERQIDGWYVDSETLPREKRGGAVAFLHVAGNTRPNIKVNQSGPSTAGLPVSQKITLTSGGESREWTIEVTELVEGSLNQEIFTPPTDFKRVITFPGDYPLNWTRRVQLLWEWFQDLLEPSGV